MEDAWTIQWLADWAIRIGLQPKIMTSGNGLMLTEPGRRQPIFAIYLPGAGDYCVELGFNPDNEQSWPLRDVLGPQYPQI